MIPLFSSDAQPECDGMRRLSVLDARRKRMSDMVDSAESGDNDDGNDEMLAMSMRVTMSILMAVVWERWRQRR